MNCRASAATPWDDITRELTRAEIAVRGAAFRAHDRRAIYVADALAEIGRRVRALLDSTAR